MSFAELRSKFTIFIFLSELDLSAELKHAFVSSGYETFMFLDQEILVERIPQAAPHIVLFSPDVLSSSLSDFFQAVLEVNSEVQFICIANNAEAKALADYRDFGLAHTLSHGDYLPERALWAVDSVCEKLALSYQNESLLANQVQLQNEAQQARAQADVQLMMAQVKLEESSQALDLQKVLERFQISSSKEDLASQFLQWVAEKIPNQNLRCVFFKFLPTVMSFVATQGLHIDLERTRGVGAKLTAEESRSLTTLLLQRTLPGSLSQLMDEGFGVDACISFPLMLRQQVEGIFVLWGIDEAELSPSLWQEFQVFQLCYQNAHYLRKSESLDILDPVTDLFNHAYFYKKLEEEIARARRLAQAVALVKLSLDSFDELESKLGVSNRDLILRSIAALIKKTSRVNDFACRTGEDEITLLLPHCSRKGAALRGERLRRAIESHSFAINGVHVTVSCGVSEYPTLARSGDELDKTTTQALDFIRSRGGNKVCLFRPAEDFKPDFEVPVT